MSKPLFEASDESDNEEDIKLNTNKEYAKSYNDFRKKELLKKLKDRGYNNVSEVTSSEESESSDEDDDQADVDFDRQFFKTLASLKSKDPSIYNKETQFFNTATENEDQQKLNGEKHAKTKTKPVTLKDYERQVILERDGKFEDDSDDDPAESSAQRSTSPTVVEEERRLKAEFRQVLNANESEDEEFGGIFKKRVKSKEEKTQEEEDFAQWLAGKKADIEGATKQKLEPLKNYWNQNNLPSSERFLRDYILNKGYANTKSSEIPTYEEIVADDGDLNALSEDEKELEKQANFEEKYNFRFEEPDTEFIKRYPRTIENSVRRDPGKRKEKRQELKIRKQTEKEQKMKEIEIVKEMKRKEIEEKIEKLKKVTGNEELGFNDTELEEDFDPEAHDRRMREIFNDEYYEVDEGEEKPECPSDIDELKTEDWDNYDPAQVNYDNDDDYEAHCEDDDFNMDCEYDAEAAKQQLQQELIDNTKRRKNRRGRRNRFMEMIQEEKPAFDPEDEQTYGEYIDEYYKMDCEDIIGDLPCRFKYVETAPNDFGLTIEEILLAKNKELNQWASLKKALQIRPDHVEKKDQRLYKLKAKNEMLKRKIFKSLYGENSDDEDDDNKEEDSATVESAQKTAQDPNSSKKSKKKRKAQKSAETETNISDTNPTEAKKPKIEDSKVEIETTTATNDEGVNGTNLTAAKKKKRRQKKKKNQNNSTATVQSETKKDSEKPQSEKMHKKPQQSFPKPIFNKKSNVKSNPFRTKEPQTTASGNGNQINDDRLRAYSINPRKYHKTQKFGKNAAN